jgi:hypothetical protein
MDSHGGTAPNQIIGWYVGRELLFKLQEFVQEGLPIEGRGVLDQGLGLRGEIFQHIILIPLVVQFANF